MSLEFSVLSDRRLSSTAEWQQAIDAEGFPLRLDPACTLAQAKGFFPTHLGDKPTGFDCYHDDAGEMIDMLTLNMNRIRQAAITREIIEVVSGAGAL